MTNPETLKQILRDAKQEIVNWPRWMKTQEPALREGNEEPETSDVEDEELSA
jgi:hypothetical protein